MVARAGINVADAPSTNGTSAPTPQPPPASAPRVNHGFPIAYVSMVVGHLDKDGRVVETIHTIDGRFLQIVACDTKIVHKHKRAKGAEGELIGFEPTGEESLTLNVQYIRN